MPFAVFASKIGALGIRSKLAMIIGSNLASARVLIAFACSSSPSLPSAFSAARAPKPELRGDAYPHRCLYRRGAVREERRRADAARSLTKMMTVYLIFEALKSGKLKLTTPSRSARRPGACRARRCSSRSATRSRCEDLLQRHHRPVGQRRLRCRRGGPRRQRGGLRRADEPEGEGVRHDQQHFNNATGWPDPNART